jgi:hypothetical protein
MGYPHAEAQLLSLQGELLEARGERASARERWAEALALFHRLGAEKAAKQAEAALAALSGDGPVIPSRGPAAPAHSVLDSASATQWSEHAQLTDAQWARIAALLPPPRRGRGRPRADDRQTLEAILYVLRTGCKWDELPPELGNDATAHRRWQEWRRAGLWEQIAVLVQSP